MKTKVITSSEEAIEVLIKELENNKELKELLIISLKQAKEAAAEYLDKALYEALSWPSHINEYITYLRKFA